MPHDASFSNSFERSIPWSFQLWKPEVFSIFCAKTSFQPYCTLAMPEEQLVEYPIRLIYDKMRCPAPILAFIATEHSVFHPFLSVLISSTLLLTSSFCIVSNPKFEAQHWCYFWADWAPGIVEDQLRDFGDGVGTNRGVWCLLPFALGVSTGGRAVLLFLSGTSSLHLKAQEILFSCSSHPHESD